MNCKYLDEGQCLIVYQLCGTIVFPRKEKGEESVEQLSCFRCSHYNPPQGVNDYTKGFASQILVKKNLPPLYTGNGPGTRLKNFLEWFVDAPPDCDCASRSAIMDAWGVLGCRHNKNQIIQWLYESAQQKGINISRMSINALIESVLFISSAMDNQQKLEQSGGLVS